MNCELRRRLISRAKSSYRIRVRSTDCGGLYTEEQRSIRVTNINEPPIATIGGLYDGVEGQPLTLDASLCAIRTATR